MPANGDKHPSVTELWEGDADYGWFTFYFFIAEMMFLHGGIVCWNGRHVPNVEELRSQGCWCGARAASTLCLKKYYTKLDR